MWTNARVFSAYSRVEIAPVVNMLQIEPPLSAAVAVDDANHRHGVHADVGDQGALHLAPTLFVADVGDDQIFTLRLVSEEVQLANELLRQVAAQEGRVAVGLPDREEHFGAVCGERRPLLAGGGASS